MAKLARRTPATLPEFMDQVDNFISSKDTLWALTEPRKKEMEGGDKKVKTLDRGKLARRQKGDRATEGGKSPPRRVWNFG